MGGECIKKAGLFGRKMALENETTWILQGWRYQLKCNLEERWLNLVWRYQGKLNYFKVEIRMKYILL